jgi:hypothetical protein
LRPTGIFAHSSPSKNGRISADRSCLENHVVASDLSLAPDHSDRSSNYLFLYVILEVTQNRQLGDEAGIICRYFDSVHEGISICAFFLYKIY